MLVCYESETARSFWTGVTPRALHAARTAPLPKVNGPRYHRFSASAGLNRRA